MVGQIPYLAGKLSPVNAQRVVIIVSGARQHHTSISPRSTSGYVPSFKHAHAKPLPRYQPCNVKPNDARAYDAHVALDSLFRARILPIRHSHNRLPPGAVITVTKQSQEVM